MDKYSNYHDLRRSEKEGEDYVILVREGESNIALMAPHGGGIEPGTVDIADAVAGDRHTFYAFKGIKKRGNSVLHITSNKFDEPEGLKVACNVEVVISIHGCHEKSEEVFIGGKNQELKKRIEYGLNKAGFKAEISETPGLRGKHPENICNRCRTGEGVQLEISRGLREKMFDSLEMRSWRKKNRYFYKFVATIQGSID